MGCRFVCVVCWVLVVVIDVIVFVVVIVGVMVAVWILIGAMEAGWGKGTRGGMCREEVGSGV